MSKHLYNSDGLATGLHILVVNIVPVRILFFKGSRPQLTNEEPIDSVRIAAARIHVERAIGRIKKDILDMVK